MIEKIKKNQFLFEELVKRDFKKKYKKTVLGMGWSVLSPLLTLLIMKVVFTSIFGINIKNYTTFLFAGNLVFSFFTEATNSGMAALVDNASIFSKVNVPKYLFLFSKIVSSLINFALIMCVFFIFVALDGIEFNWIFISLLYPIICLTIFNLGMGLILSASYVFFKDMSYLWNIFTFGMSYLSAIFYSVDSFPKENQYLFLFNPLYVYIQDIRSIVIDGRMPDPTFNILTIFYAVITFGIGVYIYKKNNHKFLYYV